MSATPTFLLPCCFACSHRGAPVRPVWKHQHNTSARRGHACYTFMGCQHAAQSANPAVIYDNAADWAGVEADWQARTERLFAAKAEKWSEPQRSAFRRSLEDRATLPGATETMQFT